jgi:hypothetical protein
LPFTASRRSPIDPVTVENVLAVKPEPEVGAPTSSGGHAAAYLPVQLACQQSCR